MFELITGEAKHIPSKPALPVFISISAQLALVSALVVPLLLFTEQLPVTPTMLSFVAAPPAPPPPPPPPPPPAATKPKSLESKPVPTSGAAPIEAPVEIAPERLDDEGEEGVPGGVEGGIPGGIPGGVLGGLPAEIPPPPPPPPPAPRALVRIGGQIQAPTLTHRVEPIYPPVAVSAHATGIVILEAIVDAEGRVAEVKVLRSAHRILEGAALAAVRQWQYDPLVLNGIPTSFVLTVVLSFNLTEAR